jgi:hypothetical protein
MKLAIFLMLISASPTFAAERPETSLLPDERLGAIVAEACGKIRDVPISPRTGM